MIAEENIIFDEIRKGEEEQVSELIERSFNEYVAPGYSEEGITEFKKFIQP